MSSHTHITSRITPVVVALLALACSGGGTGRADAASVFADGGIYYTPKGLARYARTTFTAAPGEANRLTVRDAGKETVFSEAALPLTAGSLCVQRSPSSASCPVTADATVDVGDGNDVVDDTLGTSVTGGPGDDVLSGRARLIGGPGLDTLTAKPDPVGDLTLSGARLIDGGQGERDTFVGAKGNDTVAYEGRKTALRIDLARDTNEDRFVAVRSIIGGDAGDAITGDDRANQLIGAGGRDRLAGGKGNDLLTGDDLLSGDDAGDELDGGPGNDELDMSTAKDRVRCGSGTDLLVGIDEFAAPVSVPRDCERARFDEWFTVRGAPKRRGRSVTVRVDQVEQRGDAIALFAGRQLLGHSRPVRRKGTYRIALDRTGRRLARRGRTVDVRVAPPRHPRAFEIRNTYRYRLR